MIREIPEVTEHPKVISSAGDLLAPVTFLVRTIRTTCVHMFADNPRALLQYTPMEGLSVLHEWVAQRHDATASRVPITMNPQQDLNLPSGIFISP